MDRSPADRAVQAVLSAANRIDARRPDVAAAFEVLEPFRHLDAIAGVSAERSQTILHLVCCVLGDAYREAGQAPDAATWYRRASEYRVEGGYVDYYADMVIEHRLSDHY